MKKISYLIICFLLIVLSGCTDNESKDNLKSSHCHADYDDINLDIWAEDDIIFELSMNFIYAKEDLDFDIKSVDQKTIDEMEKTVLTQLGLNEENEGVKINLSKKENHLKMKIDVDLKKTDSKVLNKFGITGNTKNVRISETIDTMKINNNKIKFICE